MISLREGITIAGKYRLQRALAEGNIGSVWVARHLQLDITIAIKFMVPEYATFPDANVRFEREAKAAAQLKSPHVVQVHDYGVDDGTPYIVMELLEGEDLSTRLKRRGRLPMAATETIVVQVCKALRRAHEAGIVHRDIKPGNIFLARHDEDEFVKVLDFGLAKATRSELVSSTTLRGLLLGSPLYMSPEQARCRKDIDHRSDLWSLGVVIFRALTGKPPFPGQGIGEVLVQICADPIPVPSQIAPDLGPEVDEFFERVLARDRAKRFQSARELAKAFVALSAPRVGRPLLISTEVEGPATGHTSCDAPIATAVLPDTSLLVADSPNNARPSTPMEIGVPASLTTSGTFAAAECSLTKHTGRKRRTRIVLACVGAAVGVFGGATVALFRSSEPASNSPILASSKLELPPSSGGPKRLPSPVVSTTVPPVKAAPSVSASPAPPRPPPAPASAPTSPP